MEKVFKKHETLITIALIIIYVVANSYTMQNFGYTSVQSAIINTILSAVILTLIFLIKRVKFYGLTKPEKSSFFVKKSPKL